MKWRSYPEALLQWVFPHVCAGCGSDALGVRERLCLRCLAALPETGFEKYPDNPVERIFWGRIPLQAAMAGFYFSQGSLLQTLMHRIKYRGEKELAILLGRLLGRQLAESNRIKAEALVPLPLFPARERKRGYNQSALLCEGMAEILNIPVLQHVIERPHHTETQTRKGRMERWKNMEGRFVLTEAAAVSGRHILLVDDVVTTGATLESCGRELWQGAPASLSVATACIAAH